MSVDSESATKDVVIPEINDDHSAHDDSNSDSEQSNTRGDRIGIINAVLAYTHYGISSATTDNVLEVVCSHFTLEEIENAKKKLWRDCDLGDPPLRKSSKGRKAQEAHFRDIMDAMFKLDFQDYMFMVESGDIARLPRFNAECLNVTAIDRRIADLNQQCFAMKLEASAYRNDYLQCQHDISHMKTVLQQHTNKLRCMQNTDGQQNNILSQPLVTSGLSEKSKSLVTSDLNDQSQSLHIGDFRFQ